MKTLIKTQLMKGKGGFLLAIGALAVSEYAYVPPVRDRAPHFTVQAFRLQMENNIESLVPAVKALPGDVIEYRLKYVNTGTKQMRNLSVILPISEGMAYVEHSALPDEVEARTGKVTEEYGTTPLMRFVKGHVALVA